MRTEQAIRICIDAPVEWMRRTYGMLLPELERALRELGFNAISKLTQTDAYYHDLEHTVLVVRATQLILRGKHRQDGQLTPAQWASLNVAALYHDIGFVRQLLAKDDAGAIASGRQSGFVPLPADVNDSALLPYHVDRGLQYLAGYLHKYPALERDLILASVERTRFPVPDTPTHRTGSDYPGLVRAADLIGQLGDPQYLAKIPRLFKEFVACRSPVLQHYRQPSDMIDLYPAFFETQVAQYVQDGLRYLACTAEGRKIARQLYKNVEDARQSGATEARIAGKRGG